MYQRQRVAEVELSNDILWFDAFCQTPLLSCGSKAFINVIWVVGVCFLFNFTQKVKVGRSRNKMVEP